MMNSAHFACEPTNLKLPCAILSSAGLVRTRLLAVVEGLRTELLGAPDNRPSVVSAVYNYVSHLSFK